MIYDSILDTIGNTPVVCLDRYAKKCNVQATLLAKCESRNPGGSAKDRVAISMIREAERSGRLQPGGTIIEATSGNTGVGLGLAAAVLGYRVILTMPDTMSIERRKILAAFGADIVLTEGSRGMAGANETAEKLLNEIPGSIRMFQFSNPDNPKAHYETTGPEFWHDTEGKLDAFVATVGTGGTLTGTARYLKQQNPAIAVYAVEPAESPMLSRGQAGSHGIQGIGANFVPENYDASLVTEVLSVHTQEAIEHAKLLMTTEGLLCGISSGAAACAAVQLATREEMRGKRIALILPDTGERYLSTALFDEN